ncbi:hypothetical protein ANCCAN_16845 [Ancylostoma caninum]|uniref:Uncharacterized protein n=1 Tax=Ancylostoma caninum TaxID=29170 RepID=A0A368FYH1_ANCCA|nr:hypothetical protein ANCCAN_16845 [Ancylostoma caninum]
MKSMERRASLRHMLQLARSAADKMMDWSISYILMARTAGWINGLVVTKVKKQSIIEDITVKLFCTVREEIYRNGSEALPLRSRRR